MKFKILFFFFFSIISLGQNAPILLKIDAITSLDSIPNERKFTINYSIENLNDKEVSFFLKPNYLISNSSASMTRAVSYTIYQNKEAIDIDKIFGNRKNDLFWQSIENAKTEEEKRILFENQLKEMKIDVASDLKKAEEDDNYFWKKDNKDLLSDIIILSPNQKKSFSKTVFWFKKRYFKIDDIEYYLDEILPHYLELTINLMKEEFRDKLSDQEFQKIMTDKSFIKGWFTSNRVEINFKE